MHREERATSYLTPPGAGSKGTETAETAFPFSTTSWYFLDEVDMQVADNTMVIVTKVIVAFGGSITDGTATTINGDDRWPDVFSRRLHADKLHPNRAGYAALGNAVDLEMVAGRR